MKKKKKNSCQNLTKLKVTIPNSLLVLFIWLIEKKVGKTIKFNTVFYNEKKASKTIDDAVKITSELHDPNTRKSHLRNKKRRPNREHWCGADRISFEDQVRIFLTTLEC